MNDEWRSQLQQQQQHQRQRQQYKKKYINQNKETNSLTMTTHYNGKKKTALSPTSFRLYNLGNDQTKHQLQQQPFHHQELPSTLFLDHLLDDDINLL